MAWEWFTCCDFMMMISCISGSVCVCVIYHWLSSLFIFPIRGQLVKDKYAFVGSHLEAHFVARKLRPMKKLHVPSSLSTTSLLQPDPSYRGSPLLKESSQCMCTECVVWPWTQSTSSQRIRLEIGITIIKMKINRPRRNSLQLIIASCFLEYIIKIRLPEMCYLEQTFTERLSKNVWNFLYWYSWCQRNTTKTILLNI